MSVFIRVSGVEEPDAYLDTSNSYFAYLPLNNNFVKVLEVFPTGAKQKLAATYNTKYVVSVTGDAFKSFKERQEEMEEEFG